MAIPRFPQFTRLFPATTPHVVIQTFTASILVTLTSAYILTVPITKSKPADTQTNATVLGASASGTANDDGQNLSDQYARWQQTVREHPDYRDGYYTLSLIAYRLGRVSEAKDYLSMVKRLDPNYEGISRLESLISGTE